MSSVISPMSEGTRLQAGELTRLHKTAGEVVGSAFFGTLLKMMRNDPLKGRYGHGGRGEEVFAGQLHGLLGERLGTALRRGPGEAVYEHLARPVLRAQEREARAQEERI